LRQQEVEDEAHLLVVLAWRGVDGDGQATARSSRGARSFSHREEEKRGEKRVAAAVRGEGRFVGARVRRERIREGREHVVVVGAVVRGEIDRVEITLAT
jgi:hypothetical protein